MRTKSGDAALAKRIKELRDRSGITQDKLAELADVSLPLIQKIENASLYGSKKTHDKLAKVLGVSASYLIYGTELTGSRSLPIPDNLTEEDIYTVQRFMKFLEYDRSEEEVDIQQAKAREKSMSKPVKNGNQIKEAG